MRLTLHHKSWHSQRRKVALARTYNDIYARGEGVSSFMKQVVHGDNLTQPEGMTNLCNMCHAHMLEGQSQPRVNGWCVEMLLPVVFRDMFMGEGKMKEREKVSQLEIGIIEFGFSAYFGGITMDNVATHQILKLLAERSEIAATLHISSNGG